MARIRYIKPEFFEDVGLAGLSREARLLYVGLWCFMDRQGICDGDPRLIKRNIFPYDDDLTAKRVAELIQELIDTGRIRGLIHEGKSYLYSPTFKKHQKCHPKEEAKFAIPEETLLDTCQPVASKCPTTDKPPANPPLTLTGNSNFNSNGELKVIRGHKPRLNPAAKTESKSSGVWEAYREEYLARWKVDPKRNSRVNSQLCQLVDRLGAEDAVQVIRFYVHHPDAYYVKCRHPVGACLLDAEKLYTEWKSKRVITRVEAQAMETVEYQRGQLERIAAGEL